ncbi:glycosyltransferase family 4 protein [Thalassospira lucentensis]|uniref:glycosyltransferase family 4 protein n=1 Tax=Thalassospira lucentensis TaxID=168935 RepID=UPI00142D7A09|nr:glycosyltransferase family 4 protein [Thalassospira lucentensis]NIZ00162.1 glycosyltransferase family 4 protein [Thalassospira lucentensis]
MFKKLRHKFYGAEYSIIHEFRPPPYGGGNQFLLAVKHELERRGIDVCAGQIGKNTRKVLFNSFNFDMNWLREQLHSRQSRNIKTVHRVDGPISAYRGKDFEIDKKILEINRELADATVFQSQFSLKKHEEIGLDFGPNTHVIMNAVNSSIFYPSASKTDITNLSGKIRIVATSWSDNARKGAETYKWIDDNLDFSKYEMTFVGNIKGQYKNIRIVPAVPSNQLASHLRDSHIYITASINDPCSNALTEALSCGLPALYKNSGGHPEIVKSGGLGFESAEEIPALLEKLVENYDQYRTQIDVPTIENVTDKYCKIFN